MKRELIYAAVIGGVVGAVLVMAAGSLAPLGAQNEAAQAEFGTIRCSTLVVGDDGFSFATEIDMFGVRVSNEENGRSARLGTRGVFVFGGKGKLAHVGVDENGGAVAVFGGKDGGACVSQGGLCLG